MGRFTPVTTSTRPSSSRLSARLEGVPPNMSVRITDPSSPATRLTAVTMARCASSGESCQPMETLVAFGMSSPVIISAAATSSRASWPCVTTTIPIIGSEYPGAAAAGQLPEDAGGRLR